MNSNHSYYILIDLLFRFNESSTINPNSEDHTSSLVLEPSTGVPLEVKIRLQINGLVRPVETLNNDDINLLYVP